MRALIGRETCCKHRCDVKMFCYACANIASTILKNVLRWKLDKFDKFTLFIHFVSGLHNCSNYPSPSHVISSYANTENVRFLLLNYNPIILIHLVLLPSDVQSWTSVISLVFSSMRSPSLRFTEIINNYPNMTKWDIHVIYDCVHPDWILHFRLPFPIIHTALDSFDGRLFLSEFWFWRLC